MVQWPIVFRGGAWCGVAGGKCRLMWGGVVAGVVCVDGDRWGGRQVAVAMVGGSVSVVVSHRVQRGGVVADSRGAVVGWWRRPGWCGWWRSVQCRGGDVPGSSRRFIGLAGLPAFATARSHESRMRSQFFGSPLGSPCRDCRVHLVQHARTSRAREVGFSMTSTPLGESNRRISANAWRASSMCSMTSEHKIRSKWASGKDDRRMSSCTSRRLEWACSRGRSRLK